MGKLTIEQIKREKDVEEEASTLSLQLTHRALSDVSCLDRFRNLERLDLSNNCLSSIQGLSGCTSLKWLKLVQNKLTTLEGVQSLSNLTVLNAGMNQIQKMDQIQSLTALGALILNNNSISSICKLDRLKYLNTLVLSSNPINDIGDALANATAITKLSLSHCQIEKIGAALTSCTKLKEAKFAHNKVAALPHELANNTNLQILDMGNNLIETWSDIKVLSKLQNLKNFNLQGNPIAQKAKLSQKVKKMVPGLRILNSKPIEKVLRGEAARVDKATQGMDHYHLTESEETRLVKTKRPKLSSNAITQKELYSSGCSDAFLIRTMTQVDKESKQKLLRQNGDNLDTKEKQFADNVAPLRSATEQKRSKVADTVEGEFDGIDNAEAPFLDRLLQEKNNQQSKKDQKGLNVKQLEGLVVDHTKKNEPKCVTSGLSAVELLYSVHEVGNGGLSAWDD